jgi:hypothetical protein
MDGWRIDDLRPSFMRKMHPKMGTPNSIGKWRKTIEDGSWMDGLIKDEGNLNGFQFA